ncbi:MAG: phosphatase PAP2 family protein, partial [Bacilli bacterium]|nr:phosphatase PAP2 family protein [Bacilli bacterium]
SGHCIICFVMIFSFLKSENITLKNKTIFIIINILIILSTLFVKQHVIYDVIGSFILTITSFYLIYKTNLLKKIKLFN